MKAYGSWRAMRGDDEPRTWLRRAEVVALLADRGVIVTAEQVTLVVAASGLPAPERKYGHNHYTEQHVEAVAAWATAKGAKKEVV